jgi:hypothetical protein
MIKIHIFKLFIIITAILFVVFPNVSKGQATAEPVWIKVVTDSIPVAKQYVELCKTDEGRKAILASMDSIALRDIRWQWQGIKDQDSTYKETYYDYLMKRVSQVCTPIPGGQVYSVSDPDRRYFLLNEKYWCESRNTGGSHEYDCNEKLGFALPKGWQICKLMFSASKVRHGDYSIRPVNIIQGAEYPSKYAGIEFHLTGHGDVGNPSRITINNIKVYAISDRFNNEERKKCGCDFLIDQSTVTSTAPGTSFFSYINDVTGRKFTLYKNGRLMRSTFYNSNNQYELYAGTNGTDVFSYVNNLNNRRFIIYKNGTFLKEVYYNQTSQSETFGQMIGNDVYTYVNNSTSRTISVFKNGNSFKNVHYNPTNSSEQFGQIIGSDVYTYVNNSTASRFSIFKNGKGWKNNDYNTTNRSENFGQIVGDDFFSYVNNGTQNKFFYYLNGTLVNQLSYFRGNDVEFFGGIQ